MLFRSISESRKDTCVESLVLRRLVVTYYWTRIGRIGRTILPQVTRHQCPELQTMPEVLQPLQTHPNATTVSDRPYLFYTGRHYAVRPAGSLCSKPPFSAFSLSDGHWTCNCHFGFASPNVASTPSLQSVPSPPSLPMHNCPGSRTAE